MTKASIKKIFAIMDNPKLSNQQKVNKIMCIFLKQKNPDWALLRGIFRELGMPELADKLS
ncbi:hypothetical protein [Gelria sp. Kuro-4]|uniref:hypothetical protein n=1 Tax=Gelria sp. Kuro-4 TaxID=2796927 RepID=UPI001BEFD27F|nr:hypothetical protein [Gelria sp. Kuro-4]BCV23266.1 hypothetical protein kuro4_00390 [Gelria sp. Kuro-4]